MPETDVVRMYNVLPAIEQTKVLIIERLQLLFDGINRLFQNKLQNKRDDEVISFVKATTISLYLMLKPKMMEHILNKAKLNINDPLTNEMKNMMASMDSDISNPSNMTIEKCLYYADIINIFCHEYGVTRITYFAGTATPSEKDIYKV